MPKIKKKGTAGQAKNFITRTQAIRKLQISLPDFRRLCIFKGIYPREPRNKKKVSKSSTPLTTFYYTKDIQYLLHEPLLRKFREHKALAKKIGRALGKGEVGDAARLEKTQTPRITLDHIIKERYPTFIDALRDLDDALSMIFLFANLPSTATIPPKKIAVCQRLCLEFEHYLILTHSMRKSFLSIKGIYYQARIQGQDILWLVPYKFVQNVSGDIDFRIMGTFVEFYITLLGFVNFRLYSSIGFIYPPKFDTLSDEKGGELAAFRLEARDLGFPESQDGISNGLPGSATSAIEATMKAQAAADALKDLPSHDDKMAILVEAEEADDAETHDQSEIDTFTPAAADTDILPQPQMSSNEAGNLFAPYIFFLSRETPRAPLEFLLRAFGCKSVGWDPMLGDGSATRDELDPNITHQIVDRPVQPVENLDVTDVANEEIAEADQTMIGNGYRVAGRTYIQPQWVWDCINEGRLLRPDLYAPGATLPPHLSPWVKLNRAKGEYDPSAPLQDQEREGEAEEAEIEFEAEDLKQLEEAEAAEAGSKDDSDSSEGDDWGGLSPDASEDEELSYQKGLEAEVKGKPAAISSSVSDKETEKSRKMAQAKRQALRRQQEEELDRQKMMMSRRKRKLLEKMLYSNQQRNDEAEKLRAKRRKIERSRGETQK